MNLYFDIGNTRVKWLVRSSHQDQFDFKPNDHGVFSPDVIHDSVRALKIKYSSCKLELIGVSSVASSQINDSLSSICKSVFGLKPVFAKVSSPFLGVSAAYKDLNSLGVDRWLALLAARDKVSAPVAIIDAGSAITLDVLDASGQHIGGWIAPGLSLLERSLGAGTSDVSFDSGFRKTFFENDLGCSTQDCVNEGIYQMLSGFLSQACLVADDHKAQIVVSGGDAGYITRILKSGFSDGFYGASKKVLPYPNIVFDGLSLWCKKIYGEARSG